MTYAPICLFTYNRVHETRQTVEALKSNYFAEESDIFIFSDGARNEASEKSVEQVREYIRTISGFKSVKVIEAKENNGLANSIISGVSQIIKEYGSVIVVEDDLITSRNFLSYMNQALNRYRWETKVFSISGFSVKIDVEEDYTYDTYFWGRAHSWGWATWADRWNSVDWEITDFETFKSDSSMQKSFNKYGSDLTKMLISAKIGKIDSWYVRFTYNQFKQEKLTVYPITSKVINNGFMDGATHTSTYNRIKIKFDTQEGQDFSFPSSFIIDRYIGKQVYRYKSIRYRVGGKLLTLLMRLGVIQQRKTTL